MSDVCASHRLAFLQELQLPRETCHRCRVRDEKALPLSAAAGFGLSSDHSVVHPAPHARVTLLKRPGTPRVNSHWPGPRRSRQRSLTVLGRHCQRRASDLARPSACWNSARCGAVLIQDYVSHPFLCIWLNSSTRLVVGPTGGLPRLSSLPLVLEAVKAVCRARPTAAATAPSQPRAHHSLPNAREHGKPAGGYELNPMIAKLAIDGLYRLYASVTTLIPANGQLHGTVLV